MPCHYIMNTCSNSLNRNKLTSLFRSCFATIFSCSMKSLSVGVFCSCSIYNFCSFSCSWVTDNFDLESNHSKIFKLLISSQRQFSTHRFKVKSKSENEIYTEQHLTVRIYSEVSEKQSPVTYFFPSHNI